jgi:hypothetical protein
LTAAVAKRPRSLAERTRIGVLILVTVPLVLVLLVPGLLLGIPGYWLYGKWLKLRWERTWGREGKRILLVYSRSPNWQTYIENAWLPRVVPHAVVVDWSDRSTWPRRVPLEIRVFRYWGGEREFNPMALLFPKRGKVRTLRFRKAFRDFKHGKDSALRAAESELFAFVDAIQREAA